MNTFCQGNPLITLLINDLRTVPINRSNFDDFIIIKVNIFKKISPKFQVFLLKIMHFFSFPIFDYSTFYFLNCFT
jgi:hypothetical protein